MHALELMHSQRSSLVSQFDLLQLPALERACKVRKLAEGEKFCREGEDASSLGFIISGRLKVTMLINPSSC